MAGSGWLRSENELGTSGEQFRMRVTPVTRTPLADDLDLALKNLLSANAADRIGLWLINNQLGVGGSGRVAEARPGPIPEQWKQLDFSSPFLHDALNSSFPLLCGPGFPQAMPHLSSLVGMQKAVWLPVRVGKRPLGLVLVAYANVQTPIHLDRLCVGVEEIAAGLATVRDRQRLQDAAEEIRWQVRISRDILADAPLQPIIAQIVSAACLYAEAEFVALRLPGPHDSLEIAGENTEKWRALLESRLSCVWQSVQRDGCVTELGGAELEVRLRAEQSSPSAGISSELMDKVIALPVNLGNHTAGVLIAGLRHSEDSSETRTRLAQYTMLAALTLARDKRKLETAKWADSWRVFMESTLECFVVVDSAGHIREANPAATKFLGIQSADIDGKCLEDFFEISAREPITQWREGVVNSVSPQSRVVLEAELLTGRIARLQYRSELAAWDPSDSHCLIRFEEGRAATNLVESGSGLGSILLALVGTIDSGVLLLDDVGKIRMVSDRFAEIMGASSRRLFELGTMDALIESLAGQFKDPVETAIRWHGYSLQDSGTKREEFEMVHPTAKVIERIARPLIGLDGQQVGRMEVYQDITTQRLVQSKLLQSEKMAALGQLVSGIAHELNNPLTSIQGYAQLLSTRKTAGERLSDARRIAQEAERAGGIVKNLLLFARETKPQRQPADLNEIVKRTLALRSYELNLENIFVQTDLESGLPLTLADTPQLQQVILNLIVNAEQAIRQGRGRGRVAIATHRLSDTRIVLEVSDDGPGIPPEVAARIFDPFFTTKAEGVGTGLGLSIVYGIVQEHGGEISVESVPNHGATVRVELPVATPSTSHALPPTVSTVSPSLPFTIPIQALPRPERILVIEDEPTVAQLIADVLSGEGYPVDVLLDSRDGLHRLQSAEYTLAICDLKMPHLDGTAIFRELRRASSAMQNRLLFVTGDTMSPQTLEFLTSSGMPYLAKPFLVEELKQIVRNSIAAIPTASAVVPISGWSQEVGRRK